MKNRLQNTQFTYKNFCRIMTLAMLLVFSSIALQATNVQARADSPMVSPIKRAVPIYPKYAVKNSIEGAVLLNFSIDTDGNLSDIQVIESDRDGLFDATAILGLQKWVFTKPSKKIRNNYIAIEFVLTDEPSVTKYANVEIIQVKGE